VRIAIASDHAGYEYKQRLAEHLRSAGHAVEDFGTNSPERCDYPDFIYPAVRAVAEGRFGRGIVLGGSGNGEAMCANRIAGIRCGLCWNAESARLARRHNDTNVLSLGERMMDIDTAMEIVDLFLSTDFEGGRHVARIKKIDSLAQDRKGSPCPGSRMNST